MAWTKTGCLLLAVGFGLSGNALGATGIPHFIDYFSMTLNGLGIGLEWLPTVGAVFATAVIFFVGLGYSRRVAAAGEDVAPTGRFSIWFIVEGVMEFVFGLTKDNCGKTFKNYLPLLSAIFVFILVSNVSGLFPGLPPATGSMDTNLAIGLISFLVYNYAGFKEHGPSYVKQLLGPLLWLAPLFFCIELISHLSRPLSLGLRLMANIYADHTLLGVFTGLTYFGFPALLMFFGLLVAVIQAFVFTLLTGIYISMAISHDH